MQRDCAHHIHEFLAAVEARDLPAVGRCFTPGARYANVPHPPTVGSDAIVALLEPLLTRATRVRWDVVASCYGERRAFLERVDRFWIDGTEYAVECNGVYEVDLELGAIAEVRDYVDLGPWRARLASAGLL